MIINTLCKPQARSSDSDTQIRTVIDATDRCANDIDEFYRDTVREMRNGCDKCCDRNSLVYQSVIDDLRGRLDRKADDCQRTLNVIRDALTAQIDYLHSQIELFIQANGLPVKPVVVIEHDITQEDNTYVEIDSTSSTSTDRVPVQPVIKPDQRTRHRRPADDKGDASYVGQGTICVRGPAFYYPGRNVSITGEDTSTRQNNVKATIVYIKLPDGSLVPGDISTDVSVDGSLVVLLPLKFAIALAQYQSFSVSNAVYATSEAKAAATANAESSSVSSAIVNVNESGKVQVNQTCPPPIVNVNIPGTGVDGVDGIGNQPQHFSDPVDYSQPMAFRWQQRGAPWFRDMFNWTRQVTKDYLNSPTEDAYIDSWIDLRNHTHDRSDRKDDDGDTSDGSKST